MSAGAVVRPDPMPAPVPRETVDYRLASGLMIEDLHPDDVREVLGVYETYEGHVSGEDAMAHALAAFRAARERRRLRDRYAGIRARIEETFQPRAPR